MATKRNKRPARADRVILSVSVGRAFGRIVELGDRSGFRFEPYVDAEGKPTSEAAASLDRPVFATLDGALERLASWSPGNACSAKALALVPHNLNKSGMRATYEHHGNKHTAFWCAAANVWVGEDLREIAEHWELVTTRPGLVRS